MFEPFIPPSAHQLQDGNAISLLHRLRRHPIIVPGLISADLPTTVPTAVVMPDKKAPADHTPLLLLHGFDSSLLEFRHGLYGATEQKTTLRLKPSQYFIHSPQNESYPEGSSLTED